MEAKHSIFISHEEQRDPETDRDLLSLLWLNEIHLTRAPAGCTPIERFPCVMA
jgi:hypothetical protein